MFSREGYAEAVHAARRRSSGASLAGVAGLTLTILALGVSEDAMGFDVYLELVDMRECREKVQPAVQAYRASGELGPAIALLRAARLRAPDEQFDGGEDFDRREFVDEVWRDAYLPRATDVLTRGGIDELISALEDPNVDVARKRRIFETNVPGPLFQSLCIQWARGISPMQCVSRGSLASYLSERSEFISRLFRAEVDVEAIGISSEGREAVLPRPEVVRLRDELKRVARPTKTRALALGYDNLLSMVELVLKERDLALVVWIA